MCRVSCYRSYPSFSFTLGHVLSSRNAEYDSGWHAAIGQSWYSLAYGIFHLREYRALLLYQLAKKRGTGGMLCSQSERAGPDKI
jgi:hypothetical protein